MPRRASGVLARTSEHCWRSTWWAHAAPSATGEVLLLLTCQIRTGLPGDWGCGPASLAGDHPRRGRADGGDHRRRDRRGQAVFGTAQRLAAWAELAKVPAAKPVECQRRVGCARPTTKARASKRVAAPAKATDTSRPPWSPPRYAVREPKAPACATSSTGCARMGTKQAAVAIAHKILVAAFHMLQRAVAFADLGADYLDRVDKHRTAKRLVRRLDALGYAVMLRPKPAN